MAAQATPGHALLRHRCVRDCLRRERSTRDQHPYSRYMRDERPVAAGHPQVRASPLVPQIGLLVRLLCVSPDVDAPRSQAKLAEAAWELVYERTRPSLVRALTAASGSYDGVEDAIQDAFGEALRRSPELANVRGWLFTVAIGRLRSHHRRARILRRLGLVAAARESDLDRALQRADIRRVLDALTRRERELLIAKHYVGMTQDEIASYMHLPRGTVSAAISRAAARFR